MSVEQNKALKNKIREEIWNKGNLELIPELVASSWSLGQFKGPDGFKRLVAQWRTACPDFHITIENMVCEGDRIAYLSRMEGTFTGKFEDNEPTGKRINVLSAYCDRFADGKWVETVWGVVPMFELYQQMGIKPPTA